MKIAAKSEHRYYLFAIAEEIASCKRLKDLVPEDYAEGFIEGLKQAQYLIRETKSAMAQTNAENLTKRKKK